MPKAACESGGSFFLYKKHLVSLKTKAMRSGAWFKVLRRIDRVLFDLTIKVVSNIRSPKLAKSISTLARRLEYAMKSSFSIRLSEIGLRLVQKISLAAQKLGSTSAIRWAFDSSFADFLGVMYLNAKMRSR